MITYHIPFFRICSWLLFNKQNDIGNKCGDIAVVPSITNIWKPYKQGTIK